MRLLSTSALERLPTRIGWLSRSLRSSEAALILLAVAVGAGAGLASVMLGSIARTIQHVVFALPSPVRLSDMPRLGPVALAMLPVGGLVLAGFSWAVRVRRRRLVDAVEANALHGGRMSIPDSLVIAGQTALSNGFGASVGLEAGYAQLGGALASIAGKRLKLRRADARILVGAGAGSAIAAAFGAPIAGAFYAFEIVIGAYTPSAIAPVAAAALTATFVGQLFGAQPYVVDASVTGAIETHHYFIYMGLGLICALAGIALMRIIAVVEAQSQRLPIANTLRPVFGGLLLVPIAMVSPQVLSGGHGALYADLAADVPMTLLATIFLAKALASIVSLGFGYRGGLFFASLFLGTLLGHLFSDVLALTGVTDVSAGHAAMVGMAAFAVAVIGGPMTMAMLVLEATSDFALTGAVFAASLVASTIVRELFGYSFSTWRLHLRGETIKSARDIGWVKTLTAGQMMRRETRATHAAITIAEFRHRFALGSASKVVLVDDVDRYAGIVQVPAAFVDGLDTTRSVGTIAINADAALTPTMDIAETMARFDDTGADELAVIDASDHVLGILSETYVRRRYAEELEKAQRALFGER